MSDTLYILAGLQASRTHTQQNNIPPPLWWAIKTAMKQNAQYNFWIFAQGTLHAPSSVNATQGGFICQTGPQASLQAFSWWMINVEGVKPLWAVPPWAGGPRGMRTGWAKKKKQANDKHPPWPLLQFLARISALTPSLLTDCNLWNEGNLLLLVVVTTAADSELEQELTKNWTQRWLSGKNASCTIMMT